MSQIKVLNVALSCAALGMSFRVARAEESKAAHAAEAIPAPSEGAEELDVENIKKKYWATGDESEMGVVQNRLYSKSHKFQFGLGTGTAISDPFLSLRPLAAFAGYNFNEFVGVNFNYMKVYSKASNALIKLREGLKEANTVIPYRFMGGEVTGSLLYGKLSLLGQKIIYYDLYLTGGAGQMKVETGNPFALTMGLGQRFYINRWFSLKADYKAIRYVETIVEKEVNPELHTVVGRRPNWTHTIVVGVDVLFGIF
jgi:outer membrane beta-barrel protein